MIIRCLSIVIIVALLSFPAESEDLLPLSGVNVGMSFHELSSKYPEMKLAYVEHDSNGVVQGCIAYMPIQNSRFWDSAILTIANGKLELYSLVVTDTSKEIERNVPLVLSALLDNFGDNYSTMVTELPDIDSQYLAPLIMWSNDDEYYAYCFTPLSIKNKVESFNCQLTVGLTSHGVKSLFSISKEDQEAQNKVLSELQKLVSTLQKQ